MVRQEISILMKIEDKLTLDEITKNGYPIVSISKEWMTWGDSYELNISNPQDEIVALAVVLTIDCVMAAQSSAAASSSN